MRVLFNDAPTPVTGDVIGCADTIFVMERSHLTRLNKKCRAPTKGKRVVVPGVPDDFEYMDPALVDLRERRVRSHLRIES